MRNRVEQREIGDDPPELTAPAPPGLAPVAASNVVSPTMMMWVEAAPDIVLDAASTDLLTMTTGWQRRNRDERPLSACRSIRARKTKTEADHHGKDGD